MDLSTADGRDANTDTLGSPATQAGTGTAKRPTSAVADARRFFVFVAGVIRNSLEQAPLIGKKDPVVAFRSARVQHGREVSQRRVAWRRPSREVRAAAADNGPPRSLLLFDACT